MNQDNSPQELVDGLVHLLSVNKSGDDQFTGPPRKDGVGRVFGGQVIAQALMAAQQSVPDGKVAHSLHAYFLRGGKEGPPINYQIERDFDGRSFSNRRVVASQTDEDGTNTPILNLTASFQTVEEGLGHQAFPMPDVARPEDLASDREIRAQLIGELPEISDARRKSLMRPSPIDLRTVDKQHWMSTEPQAPKAHSWFKTIAPLPDDPAIHRGIIAYASDYTLLGTSALPHGLSWMREELISASLDHTIWFHRPARADEWLLYTTDSPWTGSGRGFNRGSIYARDGTLVASVAQEGMIRKRRAKPA